MKKKCEEKEENEKRKGERTPGSGRGARREGRCPEKGYW